MCEWGKTKLSRMVGDLKYKRKAIAAHRALLLDLLAAPTSATITPLFPFLPSCKPSQSPPPHHFTSHTSTPTSLTPSPLQPTVYSPPGTTYSSPRHIHASRSAHNPSRSSPPHHFTSLTPSPLQPTVYSPPGIAHSPPRKIHTSRSAPCTPSRSIRPPYIAEKKALLLLSSEKKGLSSSPSPDLSSTAASQRHGSKHLAQRAFWAAALLALLCTFLCIGKEIAFAVAVGAHLILWLALRLCLLARGSSAITINHTALDTFCQEDFDKTLKQGTRPTATGGHTQPLSRSATVPHRCGPTFSTPVQWSRRSKSWTKLDSLVQEEGQPSVAAAVAVAGDFRSSMHAGISLPQRGKVSAKLKLHVVLLFSLCGLFHGRIVAVCMALLWILIQPTMESLFLKRRSLNELLCVNWSCTSRVIET